MKNIQNSCQGNINDQVSVDVNALTLSLKEEFKQLHPVSRECCIYRVPKRLRVLNENAYTPQCVSIGPYHYGKDKLKAMEEHKTMYLQIFLTFSKVSLETFISYVRDNERRLRNCYEERIDISSERFVRLMLVDAAFVIMVMLTTYSSEFCNKDELLYNKPWMILDIRNDMILLENQLPFFILDHLFVLSNLVVERFSMVKLSSHFLDYGFPSWVVNPYEELDFSESKHLVDFLRIGHHPLKQNMHKALDVLNLPSAVELHRAGVTFKCGSSLKLVNINFSDGILEIPQLIIEDTTEILFRNLQAFEQSHFYNFYNIKRYFNDYICMISLLVKNGKDVEILTKEKIIKNWFHDNEQVVRFLHNLNKENDIDTENFYFTDVVNDLNMYCKAKRNRWRARRNRWRARWNRWRASLKQNYFYNPWAAISVIAATLLLLLTIVQTICSILQVKQQQ